MSDFAPLASIEFKNTVVSSLSDVDLARALLGGSRDFVAVLDRELRFLAFNHVYATEFERIFGVAPRLGAALREAIGHLPEEWAASEALWRRAVGGEEFSLRHEFGAEGLERRIYDMVYRPVLSETGEPLGATQVSRDVTDQVAAERRREAIFRHTEESLALAMKGGRMGWWSRDLLTGEVTWSPELEAIFGLPAGSFGRDRARFIDLILPEDREAVNAIVAHAIETGEDYTMEFRFRRSDGSVGWMEGRGRALYDAEGKARASYGIGIDVTQRRSAEEALRRGGETFESLVRNSPFGVYVVDADFRLALVSQGAQKVFANVRPLLGRDFSEVLRILWEEPFASEAIRLFRRTLDTGEPYHAPSTVERREDLAAIESYDWKIDRIAMPDGRFAAVCHFYDLSERLRYESVLKESEARYRALTEASPQTVWLADSEGAIVYCNPWWCAYSGLTAEESRGQGWMRAVRPDYRPFVCASWRAAAAKGVAWEEEIPFRQAADGAYRWHIARGVPIRDDEGRVSRWAGIALDVHERKEAESALRRSSDRWRFLARLSDVLRASGMASDLATQACGLLAEALNLVRCTYTLVDLDRGTAFTKAESLRGDVSVLGEHRLADFGEAVFARSSRGETVVNRDVAADPSTVAHRDAYEAMGTRSFVHVPLMRAGRLVAFLDAHAGEPRLWAEEEVGLVVDAAARLWEAFEREAAEEALREAQARTEGILASTDVATWVLDVRNDRLHADRNLARFFDLPPSQVEDGSAMGYIERIHADDRERVAAALAESIARGTSYDVEYRIVAGGAERWVTARGVPELDEAGRVVRLPGVLVDVTALKAAERRAAEAAEALRDSHQALERRVAERTQELTRANRDLEELSYSVAHDLRAPLRAIVSTSRILLEDLEDRLNDDERAILERQATNGVRLARIVDDLLGFAKLAGADLKKEAFDLTAVAQGVAEEVLRRWAGCRIDIEDGMRAVGDPKLVGYALTNLLDNACKFSPNGGTVEVGEADGAYFVRDQGVGFDMQHAGKLFVAFERLVDQETFQGTGVGLANVKRIVEKHGGRIWAEGELGKGATFWFTLG